MKVLNVKSTMVERLLDFVSPHYCCSCGEIGSILCEGCKYDITSERFSGCTLCGQPTLSGSHARCHSIIERTWCGGERTGGLERLIDDYKFEYVVAAHKPLGDILLAALPELPSDTIVVPIPTVRTHVRQRGYDHTLLLARYVADNRNLQCSRPLLRINSSVQRGANRKTRVAQAKAAFGVRERLDPDATYLLIDDVLTTGSTLRFAAKAMKDAGATVVWAVVAARQPLD